MNNFVQRQKSMNMFRGSFVFLILTGVLAVSAAHATEAEKKPRYSLVEGNGYTVCEAFVKNLNAFPAEEPMMACEQKIHPSHPEFTRPTWEELDIQSNLKIIYEAERLLLHVEAKPKPFEEWLANYQEQIKSGVAKPVLKRFIIDLNGSGPETLIWYERSPNRCTESWKAYQYIGGSNSNSGYLFILRSGSGLLELFGGLIGNQYRVDTIIYQGRPFFIDVFADKYSGLLIGLHPVANRLTHEGEYIIRRRCKTHASFAVTLKK